jgi:predicted DNA-binding antitoxin AbrB/MazE fold protein
VRGVVSEESQEDNGQDEQEERDMTLTVEAIYEDGVLKPVQPLPLKEHERVEVTVNLALQRVKASSGMIGWQGDAQTLERLIEEEDRRDEELP